MQLNEQIGITNAENASTSDSLAFAQTQDGYLQQVSAALNQMASWSPSAQDPTKSGSDIANYQTQFAALQGVITSAMSSTFNGQALFASGGTYDPSQDATNGTKWASTLTDIIAGTGAVSGGTAAFLDVAGAITALAATRGQVGATETALTYQSNELGVLSTNLAAAKSTITDVDVAQESTNYAKDQILVQSGTAMLAQANQNPQSVLKLLQ